MIVLVVILVGAGLLVYTKFCPLSPAEMGAIIWAGDPGAYVPRTIGELVMQAPEGHGLTPFVDGVGVVVNVERGRVAIECEREPGMAYHNLRKHDCRLRAVCFYADGHLPKWLACLVILFSGKARGRICGMLGQVVFWDEVCMDKNGQYAIGSDYGNNGDPVGRWYGMLFWHPSYDAYEIIGGTAAETWIWPIPRMS